jgi:DNA helicase MCM8
MHFGSRKVAENLNMAKPILSRFDLVFILRDRADKSLDGAVSSNIMNLYRGRDTTTQNRSPNNGPTTSEFTPGNGCNRMPLSERLAWVNQFQKEPLPATLVKDYIAYAREYCKPKLTAEAAAVLKEYFMNLRYVFLLLNRTS